MIYPKSIASDPSASVAIIVATFNAENYLSEQISSILKQTHQNFVIYIFDDNSDQSPTNLLKLYNLSDDRVKVIRREKRVGFAKNFLLAVSDTPETFKYFAYCDQDDIWFPKKLEIALNSLHRQDTKTPALYISRTAITAADGQTCMGLSPNFRKPPSFKNALVQSIGGGNTMVFNNATAALIRQLHRDINVVSHDWLTYILVTATNGFVFFDHKPSLKYRQHQNGLVGATNQGIQAKLKRLRMLLNGEYQSWTTANIEALSAIKSELSDDAKETLAYFSKSRTSGLLLRTYYFFRSGVHRQSWLEQWIFWLVMLAKRL